MRAQRALRFLKTIINIVRFLKSCVLSTLNERYFYLKNGFGDLLIQRGRY